MSESDTNAGPARGRIRGIAVGKHQDGRISIVMSTGNRAKLTDLTLSEDDAEQIRDGLARVLDP